MVSRTPLCPFCRSPLQDLERVIRCGHCATVHHTACWNENANHCSVFRCSGFELVAVAQTGTGRAKFIRLLILFHCLANLTIHFLIHSVRPLVESLRVPDALALIGLECAIIASGFFTFMKFKDSIEESSLKPLAAVVIFSNAVFVSFLLGYLAQSGLEAFYALISF